MTALVVCASAVLAAIAVTVLMCRRLPVLWSLVPWIATTVFALIVAVALLNKPFGGGTDELIYQHQAETVRTALVLTGHFEGDYIALDAGKGGWPTLLGIAYYLSGSVSPYIGIVINASVFYVAMIVSAAVGCRVWPDRAWRNWLGVVLVMSPPLLLFAASLTREGWAWLAVAIAAHALLSLVRGRALLGGATLAGALLLAFWMRAPLAGIILVATLAALVISWSWRRLGLKVSALVFIGLVLVGQRALRFMLALIGLTPEALLGARDYLATSASTGFPPSDPFTLAGLAEAMARILLGPFPWEYQGGLVWMWILVNWCYWVLMLGMASFAVRRTGATAESMALIVFALTITAGLAISLTNYGIVVRMRATVLVAILPLLWGLLPDRTRSRSDARRPESNR